MTQNGVSLVPLTLKAVVAHTITYVIAGMLALFVFDYRHWFAQPPLNAVMRPLDDPWVMAGPLFQPLRGLLVGFAFYPLRGVLFGRKNGWLVIWLQLVVLGILSTFGPAPGSIEGAIYTTWPLRVQLFGLPEVLLQSLLFAALLHYWVRRPQHRWLTWSLGILCCLLLLLPALGLLVSSVAHQRSG